MVSAAAVVATAVGQHIFASNDRLVLISAHHIIPMRGVVLSTTANPVHQHEAGACGRDRLDN